MLRVSFGVFCVLQNSFPAAISRGILRHILERFSGRTSVEIPSYINALITTRISECNPGKILKKTSWKNSSRNFFIHSGRKLLQVFLQKALK